MVGKKPAAIGATKHGQLALALFWLRPLHSRLKATGKTTETRENAPFLKAPTIPILYQIKAKRRTMRRLSGLTPWVLMSQVSTDRS